MDSRRLSEHTEGTGCLDVRIVAQFFDRQDLLAEIFTGGRPLHIMYDNGSRPDGLLRQTNLEPVANTRPHGQRINPILVRDMGHGYCIDIRSETTNEELTVFVSCRSDSEAIHQNICIQDR